MRLIVLAALAAFAVGGCASPAATQTPVASTAALQQKVLAAEVAYEAPLEVAIAYKNRPRCTTPRTIQLCSDQEIVDQIRKINHDVMAAFSVAMSVASTPGASESAVTAAIAVATNSIGLLQTVIANK